MDLVVDPNKTKIRQMLTLPPRKRPRSTWWGGKLGRIRRMIITFLRRWYLANCLYRFSDKKVGTVVDQGEFIEFILKQRWCRILFLQPKLRLKESEKRALRDLIKHFEKENVFEVTRISSDIEEKFEISLGTRGWEVYSWTYLVFQDISNVRKFVFLLFTLPAWILYGKTIWSGFMRIVRDLISLIPS